MFKHMKLQKKLILAFVITLLLSSIAGVIGINLLNTLDGTYSTALMDYGFSQGKIGRYTTKFQEQRALILYLFQTTDAKQASDLQTKLAKVIETLDSAEKQVATHLEKMGDKASADYLTAKSMAYGKARTEVLAQLAQGNVDLALAGFRANCAPLANEITDKMETLMQERTTSGIDASRTLSAQSRMFSWIIVGIMLVSAALSIVFALYIARSIARPINACTDRLKLLATGDLQSPVPVITSRDEMGMLGEATKTIVTGLQGIIDDETYLLGEMAAGNFNVKSTGAHYYIGDFTPLLLSIQKIISSLNNVLYRINESAEQVASGSDQVSGGAQALSQGTTEQASSVEELAATITEISKQVKDNAENAASASQKSNAAGDEVGRSNQKMEELICAMDGIFLSSQEIGKVIKTIEDIAFQTNILALNAAVEAARAGAAGKGFAVVADEVRNLSGKSAEAAKSTTELIENSIQAVENGTHLADEMAGSLKLVVAGTKDIVGTVNKIAAASNEQAHSIMQVTLGIEQISAVVQTNSATAEQSAAASEELSGQAQILKGLVSRFTLSDNELGQADYR